MGNGGLELEGVALAESPDGLSGTGGLEGDTGRLWKALNVGVMGVLEGRSTGKTKFRKDDRGVTS